MAHRSVFTVPAFRRVFAAAAVSEIGTQISYVAIPLVAVVALHGSPGEVGVLAGLSTVAFLVIGLPVGAWVDRMRRRKVLVAADLARAALLGSVPLAWWQGVLTMAHLYAVVLAAGGATVFFDVAKLSYLPHAVGRDRLEDANANLVVLDAAGDIGGRGVGGYLAQALSAPVAVGVDALTYLWSAACLLGIRAAEPGPAPGPRGRLIREMHDGLRYVLGHPVLRPILLEGACTNLSIQLTVTMLPVVFVRELGFSGAALGGFLASGGVGLLAGSMAARRVGRRLGQGRALWQTSLWLAPAGLLVPLVGHGAWVWLAALAWVVTAAKIGVDNVIKVSFRQRVTPEALLGRMNATFRFLLMGALTIGGFLAGLIGAHAGPRAVLWLGAAIPALSWLLLYLSPLRRTTTLPDTEAPSPSGGSVEGVEALGRDPVGGAEVGGGGEVQDVGREPSRGERGAEAGDEGV
ncbi:MFS transporter [Actinomadura sp. WMMA1423]|uniref:MFS transporter n=1 Tax=Actinomadura sp. WMMA1423 TaxID=2591108 RepID=UPI0011479588|nr:MFS transporter [Actinomadura sp. WMMA1423]